MIEEELHCALRSTDQFPPLCKNKQLKVESKTLEVAVILEIVLQEVEMGQP